MNRILYILIILSVLMVGGCSLDGCAGETRRPLGDRANAFLIANGLTVTPRRVILLL